jgi:hypothetical protein
MTKYIDKTALIAEIKRLENDEFLCGSYDEATGFQSALRMVQEFIDTLEVKDANKSLRTEYEKGRADVIADTLSWLANCWPRYCSNQTIIEGFKEAIKE